jgi:REP element-mobilizing transposase RayT
MYHVTLRGNHQQDIFFTLADRDRLNQLFSNVLDHHGARMHAYCYMSNHIHALIQVAAKPLGPLILRVASRYARVTQATLATTGHLFERRYHCVLVDADSYFMALLRYIHLNPVAAGLVSTPDEYSWSSHHAYLGLRREDWVTTEFGLGLFGKETGDAIRAYRRFVNDGLKAGLTGSPLDQLNQSDNRILGSDDFAQKLLGTAWKPRSRKSLEELLAEACSRFNVSAGELRSPSRIARLVVARAWIAVEAQAGRIASLSAVARFLHRDESSLRRAVEAHRTRKDFLPDCRPGTL